MQAGRCDKPWCCEKPWCEVVRHENRRTSQCTAMEVVVDSMTCRLGGGSGTLAAVVNDTGLLHSDSPTSLKA